LYTRVVNADPGNPLLKLVRHMMTMYRPGMDYSTRHLNCLARRAGAKYFAPLDAQRQSALMLPINTAGGIMRSAGAQVILCIAAATCGFAQSTSGDLSQLKQELQQVEENMQQLAKQMQQLSDVTRRLQSQIATLEKDEDAPPRAVPSPPPSVPPPQLPVTYIGTETRTRQTDEDYSFEAPRIDNEEIDPTLRGYFRLPGTQTLIRFTGFVKTDFFYDPSYTGAFYGGLAPSSFPSGPQPNSVDSTVSIRPSRMNTEFRQPLGDDTLKVLVAWDLYGPLGRNALRLRSFWGQYKNFLVGQNWSAFGDADAFPETLDFQGPPGMINVRHPQFRYTYPVNRHFWTGLSVEKSGANFPAATVFGVPVPTSKAPDMVAFARFENNHGHLQAAVIGRSLGGYIPNTAVPDLRLHTWGYGASLSGVWRLGKLRDNISFQGLGGRGIGDYYNDNTGPGADVGFDANGRLVATPTWSASVGYQHYWTRILRSNANYGYLRVNNTAGDPGISYHVSNYATGNIIVQPSPLYLFGAEFGYASLQRKNDFEWIGRRIQLSLSFFFNRY
jgi:hypothetical protein